MLLSKDIETIYKDMTCKQTSSVFYNEKFNCIDNYISKLLNAWIQLARWRIRFVTAWAPEGLNKGLKKQLSKEC